MKRNPKRPVAQGRVRHYKVTRCKHRDFREIPVESPQLRWVDSVLRSFQEETPPEDWLPAQYRQILSQNWQTRRLH